MRIDGRAIAQNLLQKLSERVTRLKKNGIHAHLVIILVGDDPASHAYIRQKELKAKSIGVTTTTQHLSETITQEELLLAIKRYNNANNIHGIIVQRPLPDHIDSKAIGQAVAPQKDVDGFHSASKFQMPIAQASLEILKHIALSRSNLDSHSQGVTLTEWLKEKKIVVIGKGETGGKPVTQALRQKGINVTIIDSKTEHPEKTLENADIVISAVGTKKVLKSRELKKGVILIGVGMRREKDGKLHGDYEEDDVRDVASFYTPVPGGIGPINVAMLLYNIVIAAEKFTPPQEKR